MRKHVYVAMKTLEEAVESAQYLLDYQQGLLDLRDLVRVWGEVVHTS